MNHPTTAQSQKTGIGDAPALRRELQFHLREGNAHAGFDAVVSGVPEQARGRRPEGLPYSLWKLLEHMRRAQHDIVEFIRDPKYQSPDWPDGYWPSMQGPEKTSDWDQSINEFRADRKNLEAMLMDPKLNLAEPIAHGDGQTLMREVPTVVDHTAWHLGEFVAVRRLLGVWKG